MREKDKILKEYIRIPEIFEELADGCLFGGRGMIHAKDLEDEDATLVSYRNGKEGYRDVVKYNKSENLVIGIENQSSVNYFMPVRTMIYDGLTYEYKLKIFLAELDQKQKRHNPVSDGISGMTLPRAISLILYTGAKVWDGPKSLKELTGRDCCKNPDRVDDMENDYSIWLIDARHMAREEMKQYRGDVRVLLEILNAHGSDTELAETEESVQKIRIQYMKTYEVLSVLTGEQKYREIPKWIYREGREKEEVQMCELLDYVQRRGEERGEKQGIEEGRSQGIRCFILDNLEEGKSEETIISKLKRHFSLEESKAKEYIKQCAQ